MRSSPGRAGPEVAGEAESEYAGRAPATPSPLPLVRTEQRPRAVHGAVRLLHCGADGALSPASSLGGGVLSSCIACLECRCAGRLARREARNFGDASRRCLVSLLSDTHQLRGSSVALS